MDLGISEYGNQDDTVSFLCEMERNGDTCSRDGQIPIDTLRHIFLDLSKYGKV